MPLASKKSRSTMREEDAFFSQTSMCPGERVVATWVQVSSGFAGLVESDSDVKL